MNPDYRDMLSALSDEAAEFLVVGAYALAVYGFPRATGDLDIWIRPTPSNVERVWRALQRFRAPLSRLKPAELCEPDVVFQVGREPRRIDILTSITGVEFEDAWQARRSLKLGGISLSVIGRDHLLINKRATGRPKDLADVAWLEQAKDSE